MPQDDPPDTWLDFYLPVEYPQLLMNYAFLWTLTLPGELWSAFFSGGTEVSGPCMIASS